MNEEKLLTIEKLFKHVQEDKSFSQKLTQQNNLEDCISFLKKAGYDIDANTILTLGNICIHEYISNNNEEVPDEILDQVVGGNAFTDFLKGFCYGFTHPISSLSHLFTPKGRKDLAKKVEQYDFAEFGDSIVEKIV